MKKLLLSVVCFLFLFSSTIQVDAQIDVSAQAAVLMNADTGEILYSKNPNQVKAIASLTKIMTAIVAIEASDLDAEVTISQEAAAIPPSKLFLQAGDRLSLRDLLYGLMLESGNDAAFAIAEYIGGNVENFVDLMNQKAQALGLENTTFANASGLPEPSNSYSTAAEVARLMRYAMTNEDFREIAGANVYSTTSMMGVPYTFIHKNKLVRFVDYVTGGKTGFTKEAGRTLATAAKVDGIELIAITLNAPDDWADQLRMFKYGFSQYGIEIETPEIRSDDIPEETK